MRVLDKTASFRLDRIVCLALVRNNYQLDCAGYFTLFPPGLLGDRAYLDAFHIEARRRNYAPGFRGRVALFFFLLNLSSIRRPMNARLMGLTARIWECGLVLNLGMSRPIKFAFFQRDRCVTCHGRKVGRCSLFFCCFDLFYRAPDLFGDSLLKLWLRSTIDTAPLRHRCTPFSFPLHHLRE